MKFFRDLFIGVSFFGMCGSALSQDVITVEPSDSGYKFVWSGNSAVLKIKDKEGPVTVRCRYSETNKGVDNDAQPYVASSFICDNSGYLTLKQIKGSNISTLIATDSNGKLVTQDRVSVLKKTY